MKKSLLIASPYLNNIGGTEIEAFTSALYLWDHGGYDEIILFTPYEINFELFQELAGDKDIKYLKYPSFFKKKWVIIVNRFFFKLGFSLNFAEYVFWKYKSLHFDDFFILTYPKSVYFFPILRNKLKKQKYITKIVMWQFEPLPVNHIIYYNKFEKIIVFNSIQAQFWENSYQLNSVVSLDIMIPNEKNLLQVEAVKFSKSGCITFGYLGRISREKNLEEMILLLDLLNNKHEKQCKLLIQGNGDQTYLGELKELVHHLKLTEKVQINSDFIVPTQTHLFYEKIDVFLVTSTLEGGPMTALEAAAAGRMIMGYDVGAMKDRFGNFSYVVNANFDGLYTSVLEFINLNREDKNEIILSIRSHYISSLSNENKGSKLFALFKK